MWSGFKRRAFVIHTSWLLCGRSLAELSWVLSESFRTLPELQSRCRSRACSLTRRLSWGRLYAQAHVVVLGFHSLLETTVGSVPRGLLRDSSSRHSSTCHQTQRGRESASETGVIVLCHLIHQLCHMQRVHAQSCPALCDPMDCSPARLLCPWNFPG